MTESKRNIPLGAAAVSGALTAGTMYAFPNRVPRNIKTIVGASLLASLGTYGTARGIQFKLNRNLPLHTEQTDTFTKTASAYTGKDYSDIDFYVIKEAADAYYTHENTLTATGLLNSYTHTTPGMNKIAMEMIIANYLTKQAGLLSAGKAFIGKLKPAVNPASTLSPKGFTANPPKNSYKASYDLVGAHTRQKPPKTTITSSEQPKSTTSKLLGAGGAAALSGAEFYAGQSRYKDLASTNLHNAYLR